MSQIISASTNSDTGVVSVVLKATKFILVSYVISVLLLALLSVIIVYTEVPETIAEPTVDGITLFGAFLSAFLTSRTSGAKGWLCGLFTGALNIFLLNLLGMAIFGAPVFTSAKIIMLACGGVCGMIGGIVGVNFGNN